MTKAETAAKKLSERFPEGSGVQIRVFGSIVAADVRFQFTINVTDDLDADTIAQVVKDQGDQIQKALRGEQ